MSPRHRRLADPRSPRTVATMADAVRRLTRHPGGVWRAGHRSGGWRGASAGDPASTRRRRM
jgi:hypothetical protein